MQRDHQGSLDKELLLTGAMQATASSSDSWARPTQLGVFGHCIQLQDGEGGWCDQGSSPSRRRIVTKTWMKTCVQTWLSRHTDKNISGNSSDKAPVHSIIVGWEADVSCTTQGRFYTWKCQIQRLYFELWTTTHPASQCSETTRLDWAEGWRIFPL